MGCHLCLISLKGVDQPQTEFREISNEHQAKQHQTEEGEAGLIHF